MISVVHIMQMLNLSMLNEKYKCDSYAIVLMERKHEQRIFLHTFIEKQGVVLRVSFVLNLNGLDSVFD